MMAAVFACVGFLAAFGFACALWIGIGWRLRGGRGGAVVCLCYPGLKELHTVRRACWLRDTGLMYGPVLLVDCGLSDSERQILKRAGRGIEFCSTEELVVRLEQERKRLD